MKITIGICTYKRSHMLERLLRSLQAIQLGDLERRDVRILVVDNHPDGQARAVCERVSGRLPIALDFIEERRRGRSFARNRAVDEVLRQEADFIAFIDDDDLPQASWLFHLIEKQKQTHADIVGGAMHFAVPAELPTWLKNSPLFDAAKEKPRTKYGTPSGIGTFNALISCRLLQSLKSSGPVFSSEFLYVEDSDFFARANRNGATFAQAERSVIYRNFEDYRTTFRGLLLYAWRLGNENMLLLQKYSTAEQSRNRGKKALKNMVMGALKLPFCALSGTLLTRSLYKLSKELGILYTYHTKRHSSP